MNASTVINVFTGAVVMERRIPFEISAKEFNINRAQCRTLWLYGHKSELTALLV